MSVSVPHNDAMNDHTFLLAPINTDDADALRQRGGEIYVADQKPGYPCRQCLRDAEIGDEVILVSHDPFTTASPYRSASPIFIHRSRCEPPGNLHDPTTQLTLRRLSVRSFDRNEMMINAAVIDGHDLGDTISELFLEQTADRLHVHNADRGCWAVAVERA
jgi:hypothetical protein